jgi:hypothetical protein
MRSYPNPVSITVNNVMTGHKYTAVIRRYNYRRRHIARGYIHTWPIVAPWCIVVTISAIGIRVFDKSKA